MHCWRSLRFIVEPCIEALQVAALSRSLCSARTHCRALCVQPSTSIDGSLPLLPNVMRVFLENGQTRSFKYDVDTTVEVGALV